MVSQPDLNRSVAFIRRFTVGKQLLRAFLRRYQQFAPIRDPTTDSSGLGEALMTMAPAKMLIA